ncbi:MAG TPA: CPBP family intramembrane metalloprotease, partial [Pseudomonadota bacterium]|nr:CPBP family intramembrane metalloprotease [Pseudomonadota bacterium]
APVGEEIGWRGFALPRMQRRMSRLSAALLLGVLWGLWHLMMNIVAGVSLTMNLASILMLIPGSLIFSWLYNRSGGSLLIAILLHMGVHLNNPNQVLPGNSLPFYINIVGMTLLGLLALADRAAWRKESDPEPAA